MDMLFVFSTLVMFFCSLILLWQYRKKLFVLNNFQEIIFYILIVVSLLHCLLELFSLFATYPFPLL